MCENFEESRQIFDTYLTQTTDALTNPDIIARALELERRLCNQH